MKKAWIAGIACLGIGGILFMAGFIGGGCKTSAFGGKTVKNTHTISENFTNISVDVASSDVRFAMATDGTCKVVCTEQEDLLHTVSVENDCLTVAVQDERKWYEFIGFRFTKMAVTVYLPASEYENISVTNGSGDIEIEGEFAFANMRLDNTSGEIEVGQVRVDRLKAHSTSGSVDLTALTSAQDIIAESTSGKIELERITCGGLSVNTTSGKIELEQVVCDSATVESTSGRVEMSNVVSLGKTEIKTVSGGVELVSCDGESYFIKTSSGSVRASFRSAKQFSCKTHSGNVNAPHSTTGGVCRVETSSGNIRLSILDEE